MKKNTLIIIILVIGILLFILSAFASLTYSIISNNNQVSVSEKINEDEKEKKESENTKIQETKKESEPEVSLSDLEEKKVKNTQYTDNLTDKMEAVHSSFLDIQDENGYDNENDIINQINIYTDEWDKELNVVYKKIMEKLTSSQKVELKNKQRKWMKNRDEEVLNTRNFVDKALIRYELTRDKTIELSELYDKIK